MIRLYSFRFRIECTFRELKQQTGAFCYHFWSKHMPRLNYYRKKTEPSALEQVESDHARRKIMQAVRAIEMHWEPFSVCHSVQRENSVRNRSVISVRRQKEKCQKVP